MVNEKDESMKRRNSININDYAFWKINGTFNVNMIFQMVYVTDRLTALYQLHTQSKSEEKKHKNLPKQKVMTVIPFHFKQSDKDLPCLSSPAAN